MLSQEGEADGDLPPELEDLVEDILELPEEQHEAAAAALCRDYPEHAGVVWRWIAISRRETLIRPASLELESGSLRKVGPYRIDGRLGRGGMGTVFLAEHESLGRRVALKMIRGDLVDTREAVERFRREMRALSRIDHPNICKMYEAGEADGVPFMATQLLQGQDLGQRIQAAKSQRESHANVLSASDLRESAARQERFASLLLFFEKLAQALHAAHSVNVIHRDLKPANVFVTDEGEPVLLDFGLARMSEDAGTRLSQPDQLLGTLIYMSPEQVKGRQVDARSDVYSLGVTIYETCSLALPFRSTSKTQLLADIVNEREPRLDRVASRVPRALAITVAKAMEKDPRRRYQSALELAEELRRIRCHEPILARPAGPIVRMSSWIRRNPIASLLILAISIGLAATLWLSAERLAALNDERIAKESAKAALAKFELLRNGIRLDELRSAEAKLYPAWPSRIHDMESWLTKMAEPLLAKRDDLSESLAALELLAIPATKEQVKRDREANPIARRISNLRADMTTLTGGLAKLQEGEGPAWERERKRMMAHIKGVRAEIRELEARAKANRVWRFEDRALEFLHGRLSTLIRDIDKVAGRGGLVERVRKRLAFAKDAERALESRDVELWREAIEAIKLSDDVRASKRYAGLEVAPQVALVPVGMDPQSKLWEFALMGSGKIPSRDPKTRRLQIDEGSAVVFVLVPGGSFDMGAQKAAVLEPNYDEFAHDHEWPVHHVELDPFFLSKFELSQGQWKMLAESQNPAAWRPGVDLGIGVTFTLGHPVESVSWIDCNRLMRRHGLELPTEAQWEYACRSGSSAPWSSGSDHAALVGLANLGDQAALRAGAKYVSRFRWRKFDDGHPAHGQVWLQRGNGFGFHNMHGNVSEWVRDGLFGYGLPTRPGNGERELRSGGSNVKVTRGGSFDSDSHEARSSTRTFEDPRSPNRSIGLRPSRALQSGAGEKR